MPPKKRETLRSRLTRSALVPALVLVSLSAVFDYYNALDLAQQAQDNVLYKTAIALATRMTPDEEHESRADLIRHIDPEAEALLRADPGDEVHFLVVDARGRLMVGDPALLPLLAQRAPSDFDDPDFDDAVVGGQEVRLIDLRHSAKGFENRVLVTETNHKRSANTLSILLDTLWPNVLLLVVMTWLMRRGITRALQPLGTVSAAIDRRAMADLTPVPQDGVPADILPLVTAINRMLERLERAVAEQQMFLSGAAHQLRTPLAGIQAQLELAAMDAGPAVRERLERMHAAIDDLAHCTQQMLTLARSSEQASSVHDFHPVDLGELLEDAASNWLDHALRHGVELGFELAPAQCQGSRWMLQELLGNLIDNAIKYSPAGGRVTVRCGSDAASGAAFLEVEDEGPGIPPEERTRVGEPYFRGRSVQAAGSGLGLAIVREVAKRHHARLQLLDTASGRGIRVRVGFAPPEAAETKGNIGP